MIVTLAIWTHLSSSPRQPDEGHTQSPCFLEKRAPFACADSIARWHALCSKKQAMTKVARFLSRWLTLGVCLWAVPAEAQSISLPNTAFEIEREEPRGERQNPLYISQKDCFDSADVGWNPDTQETDKDDRAGNTWIVFEPQVTGTSNPGVDRLEVWVSESADCTTATAREDNRQCWLVYREDEVQRNNTLIVNPRDVIKADKSLTSYDPTAPRPESICTDSENLVQKGLTFYILYRTNNDSVDASISWDQSPQDLAAPPPPDNVKVGAGDEHLFFEWEIESSNEDNDTLGFVFYCVPEGSRAPEEEVDPAGTGGDGTGGDGTGGDGTGGDGTGGDGTGGGTGGDLAAGGMGGATSLTCDQDLIADGEFPHPDLEECGDSDGRTTRSKTVGGVQNYTNYAVGVAAIDGVGNLGRVKVFSQCLMPQEVTTFYEGYDQAGGKGGGGFCQLRPGQRNALFWLLLLALSVYFVRRKLAA